MEYKLKAVALYNFAKYVTWPPRSFADDDDPIQICVIEPNPFGEVFKELAQKTAQNRPVTATIITSDKLFEATSCHILFYSAHNVNLTEKFEKALKRLGILTVTEEEGKGAIIFKMQGGKLRFEIDMNVAREAGLTISSQVLKLASSVKGAESTD